MLSKESGMAVLLLVPLCDAWRNPGTLRRRLRDVLAGLRGPYLGYLAVAAGYLALRSHVLGGLAISDRFRIADLDNPLAALPFLERLVAAGAVLGKYLLLFVWPLHLSSDYSFNAIPVSVTPPNVWMLLHLFIVAAVLGLAWLARGVRGVAFGLAFFLLAIAPVSNIPVAVGTIFGERLTYLPKIGLCIAVAGAFGALWKRLASRSQSRRVIAVALACLVVMLLAGRSLMRNRDWVSDLALSRSAVASVPQNAKAQALYGRALFGAGRIDEAETALERAVVIYPRLANAHTMLGVIHTRRQDHERAREAYLRALQAGEDASTHFNMALAYSRTGDPDRADQHHRRAIALDPGHVGAHLALGVLLGKRGEWGEAADHLDSALELNPRQTDVEQIRETVAEWWQKAERGD